MRSATTGRRRGGGGGDERGAGEGKAGKPLAFLHTGTKVRVVMYDSRGWAGI